MNGLNSIFSTMARGAPLGQDELMKSEYLRLGTFSTWPDSSGLRPIPLSKAGFYYTGNGTSDQVTCFNCKTNISQWSPNDNPLAEHQKLSPNCDFLKELSEASAEPKINIPMPSAPNMTLRQAFALLPAGKCNQVENQPKPSQNNQMLPESDVIPMQAFHVIAALKGGQNQAKDVDSGLNSLLPFSVSNSF